MDLNYLMPSSVLTLPPSSGVTETKSLSVPAAAASIVTARVREGTGQVIRLLDNFFFILQEAPSRWSSAAACLSSTTGLAR